MVKIQIRAKLKFEFCPDRIQILILPNKILVKIFLFFLKKFKYFFYPKSSKFVLLKKIRISILTTQNWKFLLMNNTMTPTPTPTLTLTPTPTPRTLTHISHPQEFPISCGQN